MCVHVVVQARGRTFYFFATLIDDDPSHRGSAFVYRRSVGCAFGDENHLVKVTIGGRAVFLWGAVLVDRVKEMTMLDLLGIEVSGLPCVVLDGVCHLEFVEVVHDNGLRFKDA